MVGLPEARRRADAGRDRSRRSRRSAAPTRSCSAPGIGKNDGRAGARARAGGARRRAARGRRRRAQRARRRRVEELVRGGRWPTVLTPHAGELGRLLEVDSEEIGARACARARGRRQAPKAIVVLKGDDTLVAAPTGRVAVSRGARARAGHGGHRRRALRRDRRDAGQGPRARPGRLRRRLRAPACRPDRRRARTGPTASSPPT